MNLSGGDSLEHLVSRGLWTLDSGRSLLVLFGVDSVVAVLSELLLGAGQGNGLQAEVSFFAFLEAHALRLAGENDVGRPLFLRTQSALAAAGNQDILFGVDRHVASLVDDVDVLLLFRLLRSIDLLLLGNEVLSEEAALAVAILLLLFLVWLALVDSKVKVFNVGLEILSINMGGKYVCREQVASSEPIVLGGMNTGRDKELRCSDSWENVCTMGPTLGLVFTRW
eukprot:CAMPEP_0170502828 /NCGR_PEP_ID=MMETSP0208-20121228/42673_1 /TAXON_ID=197538 /ORGANISM="Strombidium inclinatum, Strain S3" /LENGTH=224 /DNA_ID=CAMNT_0010782123 /DNA_START=1188 /DNA_END=1863 /DNA_ORIENTATION=-